MTTPTAIHYANKDYHTELNEFKKSIILWAQNQATGQRTQAAIGHTKKNADNHNAKAESYDFMAKYLEGMQIRE